MEEIKFTQEELKELGFNDVQELQAHFTSLKSKPKVDADKMAQAVEKLTEAMENWTNKSLEAKEDAINKAEAAESKILSENTVGRKVESYRKFDINSLTPEVLKSVANERLHKDVSEDFEEKSRLQKTLDDAYLLTAILGGIAPSRMGNDNVKVDFKTYRESLDLLAKAGDMRAKAVNAALDTQTATQGLEWIPTNLSNNLIDYIWRNVRIASLFNRINMPTPVYKLPLLTGHAIAYGVEESLAPADFYTMPIPASTPDSGDATLTAKKIAAMVIASYELNEDNVFDVVNLIRQEVSAAIAHGLDTVCLNGDTANTLDGGLVTHAKDVRRLMDGIRKGTNVGAKVDLATFSVANLRALRAAMGPYALELDNLAFIASIPAYFKMLGVAEVLTVDKYGPNATIVAGEMGKFDGITVAVSDKVYTNLNATGVYDGTTTTKTILALINRRGYVVGDRRLVTLETATSITAQQNAYQATWRGAFKKVLPSAENTSAIGYNIAV